MGFRVGKGRRDGVSLGRAVRPRKRPSRGSGAGANDSEEKSGSDAEEPSRQSDMISDDEEDSPSCVDSDS